MRIHGNSSSFHLCYKVCGYFKVNQRFIYRIVLDGFISIPSDIKVWHTYRCATPNPAPNLRRRMIMERYGKKEVWKYNVTAILINAFTNYY